MMVVCGVFHVPEKRKKKRGPKSKKQVLQELKILQKHFFWDHTKFFCPHCRHVFTNKEMWKGVTDECLTLHDITELLQCSWLWAWRHIKRYGLAIKIVGTRDHNTWHDIALTTGFESPQEMFYVLRVQKGWGPKRIADFLDISDWRLIKEVSNIFLHPKFRYTRKEFSQCTPVTTHKELEKIAEQERKEKEREREQTKKLLTDIQQGGV